MFLVISFIMMYIKIKKLLNIYIIWSWLRREWDIWLGGGLDWKIWFFFVCDVISYSISVCIIVVFFKEGFVGFVGFFLMFIILEKNI